MKCFNINSNFYYIFIDIGNSTYDILITDYINYKTFKIDDNDSKKLQDFILEIEKLNIDGIYISSVNSKSLNILIKLLGDKYKTKIVDIQTMQKACNNYHIKVDNLNILGSDLFCDIVSKENKNGEIIVDLGTASKIVFLDKNGYFHGCQIFPGLASFPRTLNNNTDLLKETPILKNPPLVSLNTQECISSGVINGGACLVARMISLIKKEYIHENADIYLTGGNAYLIKDKLKEILDDKFIFDELHVLKGLLHLFDINTEFLEREDK